MRPKALVTGGAGFIGSELAKLLLNRGFAVTVFDNLSFGRREHVWRGARFVKGDLRSERALRNLLVRRFDVVFHLAAIHFIPYCNAHPDEAIEINVQGTLKLLQALRNKPPGRFFFASTAAVYNTTSAYHRETELPAPMDIYGTTKLMGEHLVRQFHHETRVPCAIGRLFNAFGPRETNSHLIPHILQQLKKGKRTIDLGNLSPYRDYIHTSDMGRAIYALTRKCTGRHVALANIAAGEEHSVRNVVRIFSRALGEKIEIRSQDQLRRRSERQHLRADLRRLRQLTGFRPQMNLAKGVCQLLREDGLVAGSA